METIQNDTQRSRHRLLEEWVETIIRKAYPLWHGWRNPVPVAVSGRSGRVWHGGKKDHFYAIYQCFYRGQYEVPAPLFTSASHTTAVEQRYRAILAAGRKPLILDCGANIGASVVWFSRRYPDAVIVAVEPAPENLDLLRKNTEGLDVVLVEGAIGAADGSGRLSGSTPLSFHLDEGGAGREVPIVSLGSAMALATDAEPFILKVDIEGGERVLFDGDDELVARFPVIILEPHDFCMPGEQVSTGFFAFHARHGRDFLFANENVFSLAV